MFTLVCKSSMDLFLFSIHYMIRAYIQYLIILFLSISPLLLKNKSLISPFSFRFHCTMVNEDTGLAITGYSAPPPPPPPSKNVHTTLKSPS